VVAGVVLGTMPTNPSVVVVVAGRVDDVAVATVDAVDVVDA
jgi:hypothetical protein